MTEIWKPVVGYESQYQVSSLGNVKSLNKGMLMSPSTTPNGYSIINLSNNGRRKCFAVHRLVAQAFLSNYNDSLEVNHKDENKANNSVENLEMCTRLYNMRYGTGIIRHAESKRANNHRKVLQYDLDGGLIKEWENARIASETLGISHANIIVACRGYYTKNSRKYPVKSAYGYVWRYAN